MFDTIKDYLIKNNIDAWVIYDFASTNPAFTKLVGNAFSTRKCFLVLDRQSKILICHIIDKPALQKLVDKSFIFKTFRTWKEMDYILQDTMSTYKCVMMEISDNGLMPRSSYVDYGTVCSIKRFVNEIVSSADMFQKLTAPFSGKSLDSHIKAAKIVNEIKNEAFKKISTDIKLHGYSDEYEIQQYILKKFTENDMVTDSSPIVAIGKNASSPHYEPSTNVHSRITKGDLVLIDLWAKFNGTDNVFADITWMGFVGNVIPKQIQHVFNVVKKAIDLALEFLEEELPKRRVCGYEVDDICNNYITSQGFGDFIVHRTGHSISLGESDHGIGVNIDNFETHDTREIINNIAFSLEPAIYMPEFGLREEINVYIDNKHPIVYTPRQKKIVLL